MEVETKFRELLLPVLGYDSIEDVAPGMALVKDLDADSIDFVEIIYLIEKNFGVVLKTDELVVAGIDGETLFHEGKLTADGAASITKTLPGAGGRYREGMTKMDLFSCLTVGDLAHIIQLKLAPAGGS